MMIDWRDAGKRVCKGAVSYGFAVLLARILNVDTTTRYENSFADYDDVIEVIMNSDMLSSDRTAIASMIPRNGDTRLYRSIITVINSDMLTSYKTKTIQSLIES